MLVKSPAPDPANPSGLGVTRCTACGHELDRYDVLNDELRRIVAPWIAACHARQISDRIVNEVWELVGYDLDQPEGSVLA